MVVVVVVMVSYGTIGGGAYWAGPTFWLLWAAPLSGLLTFLGDENFFFLY